MIKQAAKFYLGQKFKEKPFQTLESSEADVVSFIQHMAITFP